jgi:hypothetical protein
MVRDGLFPWRNHCRPGGASRSSSFDSLDGGRTMTDAIQTEIDAFHNGQTIDDAHQVESALRDIAELRDELVGIKNMRRHKSHRPKHGPMPKKIGFDRIYRGKSRRCLSGFAENIPTKHPRN